MNILKAIPQNFGLEFFSTAPEEGNVCFAQHKEVRDDFKTFFTLINLLDYMYAVLHPDHHLEAEEGFLKSDIHQVPVPENENKFWELVHVGERLREKDYLKNKENKTSIAIFPIAGDNKIAPEFPEAGLGFQLKSGVSNDSKKQLELEETFGQVWINELQYFDNVPKSTWEFHIGDYHPTQRWLSAHQDQKLTLAAILEYQEIIVAVAETYKLVGKF